MTLGELVKPAASGRRALTLVVRVALFGLLAVHGCKCSDDKPAAPPVPKITSTHQALWGSGPNDVWAVGPHGAIAHYDGKTWTEKDPITTKSLVGVSGSGPDDVWAVGQDGITLHYDGKAWKVDDAGTEGRDLMSVWSVSKNEAWASGIDDNVGIMRHYHDGKEWEMLHIGPANSLWRTYVSSPTDVWMAGAGDKNEGFVLRGDGKKFDKVPFEGKTLRAIFGSGPNDVWIAGYDGAVNHWDGKAWTEAMNLPKAHWLNMFGFGPKDVWLVGFEGMIYHYDGAKWSQVPSGTKVILWTVWGAAPNDVWVAGNDGTFLHWDGKAFNAY